MKIVTQDWTSNCGDGCCSNWGTDLWIDDKKVDQTFSDKGSAFEYVLTELLGHEIDELEGDYQDVDPWE